MLTSPNCADSSSMDDKEDPRAIEDPRSVVPCRLKAPIGGLREWIMGIARLIPVISSPR